MVRSSIPCAEVKNTTERTWVRLVGRRHDLQLWTPDKRGCRSPFSRSFPSQLRQGERWVQEILTPLIRSCPVPLAFHLQPAETLESDKCIQLACIVNPGPQAHMKEIVVYRKPATVHVFDVVEHGRRFYRTLAYSSNPSFSLHEMHSDDDGFGDDGGGGANANANAAADAAAAAAAAAATAAGKDGSKGAAVALPRANTTVERCVRVILRNHAPAHSLVIMRNLNAAMGLQTFIPSRLLQGLLPEALLEEFVFWQNNATHHLVAYQRPQKTKHSAKARAKRAAAAAAAAADGGAEESKGGETAMPEPEGGPNAVAAADDDDDEEVASKELYQLRIEIVKRGADDKSGFSSSRGDAIVRRVSLLRKTAATRAEATEAALAVRAPSPSRLSEAGNSESNEHSLAHDATPLSRSTLDSIAAQEGAAAGSRRLSTATDGGLGGGVGSSGVGGGGGGGGGGAGVTAVGRRGGSEMMGIGLTDIEDKDAPVYTLLNLLKPIGGATVENLCEIMRRLDNPSHVLAWSRSGVTAKGGQWVSIDLVELPRLGLRFEAKDDEDPIAENASKQASQRKATRLYCLDHAGLFVSSKPRSCKLIQKLLRGVPHGVVLEHNETGQLFVLLAASAKPGVAVRMGGGGFTTLDLQLDRMDDAWSENLNPEVRHYLYPIHPSRSFMFTPTLASAMYLLLLRLINRQYDEVFRLADFCVKDEALSAEEQQLFDKIVEVGSLDNSTDAIACRLKIILVTSGTPMFSTIATWAERHPGRLRGGRKRDVIDVVLNKSKAEDEATAARAAMERKRELATSYGDRLQVGVSAGLLARHPFRCRGCA